MKTSIPYRFTPFVAQLGVEMVHADADHSEIRLALEDRHLNGLGVAHGGLLMTLLDAAMAAAARAKDPDGHGDEDQFPAACEGRALGIRVLRPPFHGHGLLPRRGSRRFRSPAGPVDGHLPTHARPGPPVSAPV
ncbi:MAG: PaaI family thioesterase [Burkholderiaceae bacterium]